MSFNKKEKLSISALLVILYLIPAGLEWIEFDSEHLHLIAISLPIWLLFFYLGPFWLFYWVQKSRRVARLHVVGQGALYVLMMFAGANIVSRLHSLAFPQYQFPVKEQILSAFLWGVFIFSMTHMYLLYQRFVNEQKLRKEAQLADLTSRLNPHFLFNSLNTISALIHSSPYKADDVLHKLADILRYSVDQQNEWVSLEQELAVCETYLTVEKARFTDNLNISWQIASSVDRRRLKVPPLLLQPLIENVMKHVKCRPIELIISVQVEQGKLIFKVKDNGKGFSEQSLDEQSRAGKGLNIVKQRVDITGGELSLYNDTSEQGGAVCEITLPIHACV
ncbi:MULTISPECIES: histidine kinase [Idiomarina]|jgi:signal transduction histidine kinase|uniref:sensor histidine kinase n=1 Tax=Idiomarina TaxID=135575 RepID=UPI000C5FAFA0|nr:MULTISPECIES: histidine kinase [Idiomarina]MAO67171.1 ATPase [Idiomarina sp.]MBF81568.1 ATPase [Idiomarina sp.]MBP58301.1 ATPase [Idiomarina sp.]|tara:strand:+ start:629 stop:1633 length:1005 start_codon:yes stop_codon:yes gene_type:complete